MTLRFLLVALLIAVAAPAAAQAPADAPLVSLTGDFDRFATETAALPPAERVRQFRARFNALFPGFYAPRNGNTEQKYDARVARALAAYPADRDKFLAAADAFSASFATATGRFRRFFPDFAITMPVYLVHSLGEMDGGTREIEGKTVAVFGADVIARIHDDSTMGPFLDHELFHLYHAAYFHECEAVWCSLWTEGLAVYVASQLNPGASDRQLMLTIPRPIRPEVEPHLDAALCFARAKFDSTERADYAEFFFGDGSGKVFPPRFGYYLGLVIAQKLGETRSLQELARLPADKVRPLMLEAMAAMAPCGGSG
jgi:hypothetical protein